MFEEQSSKSLVSEESEVVLDFFSLLLLLQCLWIFKFYFYCFSKNNFCSVQVIVAKHMEVKYDIIKNTWKETRLRTRIRLLERHFEGTYTQEKSSLCRTYLFFFFLTII